MVGKSGLGFVGVAAALGALILSGAAAAQAVVPPPSVQVTGEGEVRVTPDRARLSLAVDALNPDLKAAEAQVNKVVRDYLAEAKKLGAKDEAISTAGVSIQPEYVWDEKERRQVMTGYRVRRDISVRVEKLDRLGDFLLRATAVGVNQVSPPVLESSREKELRSQALVLAARDAEAKAKLLAETLRVKLGAPLRIGATDSAPPPMPMMKVMSMRAEAAGGADAAIALGDIRISASVSAEFALLP